MNLYSISQNGQVGYNEYDNAVVCAKSDEEATAIHPSGNNENWGKTAWVSWCSTPEQVKVKHIGTAAPGIEPGVVCASYNAG